MPTNTQDEWYKSISTLGTEQTSTTPYYSENEEWVCVLLKCSSPILEKQQYGETLFTYSHAKINTPNILAEREELSKYVTYASENVNYPTLIDKMDMKIEKDIRLVFSKNILLEHHETISRELKEVLATINDECELLLQDNLARGKMVESVKTMAWWTKSEDGDGEWNFSYDTLEQKYLSNHPDEYWGQLASIADVVAGCYRYPWMPADISSPETWRD